MANGKRVVLAGKLAGIDDVRHVFTVSDAASDNDIMTFYATWLPLAFNTSFLDCFSTRLRYDRFILETYQLGHWVYQQEVPISLVGTRSEESLPNQVSAVVIGITQSRRRGKKFFSGLVETQQADGLLTSASLTRFNDWAEAWVTPTHLVPGTTIITGVCKADSSNFVGFSTFRANQVLGTQRRRKPGVGS